MSGYIADCTGLPWYDEKHNYIQAGPIELIKDSTEDNRLAKDEYMGRHIEKCTKCGHRREITGFYGGEGDES